MKRLTDKSFRYTPSHSTDISKRFRAELKRIKAAREAQLRDDVEAKQKVATLRKVQK